MSFHRKSDFGVVDDEDIIELQATVDLDGDDYTDETVPRSPSLGSDGSADPMGRQIRSASISVATGPTSTGLSFILDMEKEEAIEHVDSLHDDIERMFDKTPEITLTDLISSETETVPSERRHEQSAEITVPIAERTLEEYDITSHRRSSFPHIHVPLRSLHSHSVKSFNTLMDAKEEKKEKKKKKKSRLSRKNKSLVFPSKTASVSASIPEVEKEEYSESDGSSYEDDDDEEDIDVEDPDESNQLLDEDDESVSLLNDTQRIENNIFFSIEDETDEVDSKEVPKLYISETDLSEKPSDKSNKTEGKKAEGKSSEGKPIEGKASEDNVAAADTNAHLKVPWILGDDHSNRNSDASINKKQGLFYIGSNTQVHENTPPVTSSGVLTPVSGMSAVSSQTFPAYSDTAPIVVLLNDGDEPLVSTSVREATKDAEVHYLEDKNRVTFLLGGNESDAHLNKKGHEGDDDDNEDDDEEYENIGTSGDERSSDQDNAGEEDSLLEEKRPRRRSKERERERSKERSEERDVGKEHSRRYKRSSSIESPRQSRHKHHRHHENYGTKDLMRRRQRGSEVQITDALTRVPTVTETEEAETLHTVDLDEMASHRMDNLQGMRKHKIGRKKHKLLTSVVYAGKSAKPRRKYFQPKTKTYDHSPHELFVELDELYTHENYEVEWREKARWIKFEEDVEEGSERWGKPHVASLSFHSLLELRKGLESGSLLLDLEASDLIGIAHRVVEDMVIRDQIHSDKKGQVMRTLLTKHKHQRDQSSLIKTLSQASFSQMSSTTNIAALTNNYNSNNNNGHHTQRSHSLPADTNNMINGNDKNALLGKKDKDKKGVGDPGMLEFVRVDVDNNMAKEGEGVHIGLVPKDAYGKDRQDHKMSLMRRIPHDAEACTVLVGCVDYLDKPAMAFVRLAEKQVLDNLTEVPLPVRFLFLLLGPSGNTSMDYHEIGRSISTLMSNQHFHEIAYRAESRSEILHAINEFLNESIVLPPGDWDQKTLLPVMDMARKRAKVRRRKQKKKEELEALIKKETEHKIPMDPLKRTGRPFGGLINDIRRRYPHYWSDITDAFSPQCVMALIFIFFACLCPCIAFGGLYGEKTYGKIGVVETIISTAMSNLIFGLFGGQPLILYGATGPVLVFEKHLFSFCKINSIDFLTWRLWIGIWVFVITCIVIALEGSFFVRYFSRFTEEVFAILISLIFINEVIQKLLQIYTEHPLKSKEFYCDDIGTYLTTIDNGNVTKLLSNISTTIGAPTVMSLTNMTSSSNDTAVYKTYSPVETYGGDSYGVDSYAYGHGTEKYNKHFNEPNTALLSTILILGTFLIAYFLRIFRNSRFLGRSARRALGDFGIFTAIVVMVLFGYICSDTYTQKLDIPTRIGHTDITQSWFINPLGKKKPMELWLMLIAVIPAFLIFLLLFLESQLTQMLLHKNEFKLKKGTGFHLDQFLLGIVTMLCGMFGLPFMCPATVRSVAHVSALAVMSRTHAPGEKPKLLGVKDQRVTNIVMNILIASTLAWGPVLRAVPMAVLFGVFLYLGVSAISGVQLYKRIKLLFMPVKHHPSKSYVRHVRTLKMHIFTIIQLVLVGILWIVKSTFVAIAFPLFVFLMVPLRLQILPRFFSHDELEHLDKEEEDSDDEEDEDPDFYQLAHMPI